MLKSKAGFKPKAKAVPRRNAPTSSKNHEASSTSASHTPAPAQTPPSPAPIDQEASQSTSPTTAVLTTLSNPNTSTPSSVPTHDIDGSSSRGQGEPTSSSRQVGGGRQPNGRPSTGTSDDSERPPPANKEALTTETVSVPQLPVSTASISTVAVPDVPGGDFHPNKPSTPAPPQVTQPPKPTSSSSTATPSIPSNLVSTQPTPSTSTSSVATSQTPPTQPVLTPTDVNGLNERQPTVETRPPESATADPSGASKPKRPRKRKADNAAEDLPGVENFSALPTKRPRAKRAAPLPGEEGYEPGQTAAKPKRTRKRKAPTETEGATEGVGTDSAAASKPSSRQREATPEDAETVQIDINQVKMADLAKDLHIGKKFSLHDKLLEQERLKRQKASEKKRQKKNGSGDEEGEAGGDTSIAKTQENTEPTPAGDKADGTNGEPSGRTSGQLAPVGEQYQIVDGVIVVDARSLQVDRHARAAEEAGELEEQEENEFTNHVTSSTYLRRNLKPQQWTEEETEQFYSALSSWGTDFETISMMFPNKTRKHVKLKFNREERANPKRINDTLVGKKTAIMNIEDYQRHTGMQYETTEAIDAELKKNQEEFDAREKAVKEVQAEENRKKREALFGAPADDAEGGKKKRGRGNKKTKVSQASL